MRLLIHLGLNKCASTYVQSVLFQSRDALAEAGVSYPVTGTQKCQYGLSRYYGFGPDAPEVHPTSLEDLITRSEREGADRLILSSEYLSLYQPSAAERLVQDVERLGVSAEYVLFSRELLGWIAALFNQYVKTVEDGRLMSGIDAFVDQVLTNRAIDIARRYHMWADLVGDHALSHYPLRRAGSVDEVLAPFERFAMRRLQPTAEVETNASLSPDQLYSLALRRASEPSVAQRRAISKLLAGGPAESTAPASYLRISADRKARLSTEIEVPYLSLPSEPLPERPAPGSHTVCEALFPNPGACRAGQCAPDLGGLAA